MSAYHFTRVASVLCAIAILTTFVSACMHAPEFPRRVSVDQVVENVRCELYDAVQANIHTYPWIERWAAVFDFTFVVSRDVSTGTDNTYVVPIPLGTFSLGLKAGLKQNARSTFSFKFKILKGLGNFSEINCSRARDGASSKRLLAGETGLRRWLSELIPQVAAARLHNAIPHEPASRRRERPSTGDIAEITYAIEFGLTVDGSLVPSWSLVYPAKDQFRPILSASASEAQTHRVIVGLTAIAVDSPTARVAKADEARLQKEAIAAAKTRDEQLQKKKAAEDEAAKIKRSLPLAVVRSLTPRLRGAAPAEPIPPEYQNQVLDLDAKQADADEAERRAREAEIELRERERELREQRAYSARTRSLDINSEIETARRLDAIIQQQIIRDAFRVQ